MLLTPILMVALFMPSEDVTKDAAKRDLDKLQGKWVMVGGEEKGDVITPEAARKEAWTFIFKGDKLTFLDHGREQERWTVRLDPKQKPAAIDLVSAKAIEDGNTNHAIYLLEEDKMTICVSRKFNPNSPKERPTKFTTKREENSELRGMVMAICKRVKN
jgi:uncharacterized protein (TIGR03067 family)